MGIQQALERGRRAAEQGMVDAVVITRKTGETTSGGVITPTYTTLYTGKARIQQRSPAGSRTDVGQASLVIENREVQLPISVTGLDEGDIVTVTSAAIDPALPGKVFVVQGVLRKSHATCRRVTVIETTS